MSIVPGRDVPAVPDEWVDAVNKAINDAHHEDLCMCDSWPAACVSGYQSDRWDLGVSLDIAVGVLEPLIRSRHAEDVADQTRLRSMGFHDGKLHLELEPAREIVCALVASARTILDDAANYTELTFEASDGGERYVLTLQRPGKLTPHEARVQAEAERDEARRALAVAEQARDDFRRACQAEAQGGVARLAEARSYRLEWPSIRAAINPDVHTPVRTVAYLKARGWVKDWERRGGEDWHDQPDRDGKKRYVFVPLDTTFVDWDKRMAELVRDLADAYGTGELGVLADIAKAD